MRLALVVLVASAPGLFVWLRGRRLVRWAEDPTLPERVHAWRHASLGALATGVAILAVLFTAEFKWALPLLILGYLAGGFPVRRALFGETWGLPGYLSFVLRAVLAFGGFWLLVMLSPAIVSGTRPREWSTAALLAVLLLAWGAFHDRVVLRLLQAVPLARPELEPRLAEIAAGSTAPMPRLFVIGSPEGRWANALALPSTGQPAVAFTRTLLEMLDVDEIAAIFAHEQAHLEHFHRARVLRLAAGQAVVVLLGTLGAALALTRLGGSAGSAATIAWPLVVALALVIRLARHQAHEADSDRRAAELCGDPDALARGLVKLHQLSLFPRRLELEREQWQSHPSLASRLRALRALAARNGPAPPAHPLSGTSPPAVSPSALAGQAAGSWVVIEAEQAHWLEGVPEEASREPAALRAAASRARSLAYAELVELRLQPRGGQRHDLVASDRSGASWSLPLAPGQVQTAQAALDAIDDRLSPSAAAPKAYRPVAPIVAAAGAVVALVAASAALVPGLLAVFLPHPGPLAALGTALVIQALAAPPTAVLEEIPLVVRVAGFLGLGAGALVLARATAWRERAGRTRSAPWAGLFLTLAAAVPLLPAALAFATGGILTLHITLHQSPAGAVLLAAAAATFLVSPRRWSRLLGIAAALLAAATLVVASGPFADHFAHDPLWARQTPAPRPPVSLQLLSEHALPEHATRIDLSPSGRSWLVRGYDHDAGSPRAQLVVGSVGGAHPRPALDLVLLDDERLLALHEEEDALALVCGAHDPSGSEEWRRTLPALESARLAVDRTNGAWRVAGVETSSGQLVRLRGDLAGGSLVEERWPAAELVGEWLVSAGPSALGVGYALDEDWFEDEGLDAEDPGIESATSLWWLLAGLSGSGGSRLLALDADGPRPLLDSQLAVLCEEPPPDVASFVCHTHAGDRTTFWSVDPAQGEPRVLAALRGFSGPPHPAAPGGLVLAHEGRQQALYRLDREGPVRLERPDASGESRWALDAAGFADGVGVIVSGRDGNPRLRLYAPTTR